MNLKLLIKNSHREHDKEAVLKIEKKLIYIFERIY